MRAIKTHELSMLNMPLSATEQHWLYNSLDCCLTHEIFHVIEPQLDEITRTTYEFSKSLQAPVLEMRLRGILVDQERRAEVITEYEKQINFLSSNLDRIMIEGLGITGFNWRSPKQLLDLFYGVLGLPPIKKRNSKGIYAPTVDRDALEKLDVHFVAQPLISHILALRDIGKKIGVLKTEIDSDGRMRTSYNIAGTTTGRFSSSLGDFGTGTNLQNIESRLRSVFIADPGMKFAYIDLEQAESRLVGAIEWELFHDGRYLDACESGDLHTTVCRLAWKDQLQWAGDVKTDRELAESPFYRQHSYRHMAKVLGHGCLTHDHEVLTPEGWKSITEKPPVIMAWREGNSFFNPVSHWEEHSYNGELHNFDGNSISVIMTADHRVPFKSDIYTGVIKEKPAFSGPGRYMPLGDNYIGGGEIVPARLIAAHMADGHQEVNWSCFHLKKKRKIQRLKELCYQYQVEFKENEGYNGATKIRVRGSWPKKPGSFQFNWTEQCLKDFVDELKHWDGTISKTAVSISSSDRETLEWYQTFGRILGIGGQIQKPQTSGFGSEIWRLQQNNRKWASGSAIKHHSFDVIDTPVYCPTVSTGWFYIRRNGKIFITGNTNYNGKPFTMAKHTKLDQRLIGLFQDRYFAAFPAHRQWHARVAQELWTNGYLTSLTGRRRWFFGRRNDDATIREAIAFDPQGSVGDILNRGMLAVWRLRFRDEINLQLLLQIHDAILVQYPEETESEIIPLLLKTIQHPIQLKYNRTLIIPSEAQCGWNWGKYDEQQNPDGLTKWSPTKPDARRRSRSPTTDLLDRIVR